MEELYKRLAAIPADEVERWKQEDRLTYKPGDLELVEIGDGPSMSEVEEERRKYPLTVRQ